MPKARQLIRSERPARQHWMTEGRSIMKEEVERFPANYEILDRVEGTYWFYWRGTRKLCSLVEQAMERQLERERFYVGWEEA